MTDLDQSGSTALLTRKLHGYTLGWFNDPPSVTNSITDFGAVGDGITDSTAAINAALTASAVGVVTVPGGTFLCSSQLFIPINTWLRGTGWGSVLKTTAGPLPIITVIGDGPTGREFITNVGIAGATPQSNILISDLTVDSSAQISNQAHNILFYKCTGIRIMRCYITGGGDGMAFVKCTDCIGSHNRVIGTINAALDHWDGCDGIEFSDNYIDMGSAVGGGVACTGLNTAGTAVSPVLHSRIVNNYFKNTSGSAVWIQGGAIGDIIGQVKYALVANNLIENCVANNGIRVSDSQHCVVKSNIIRGAPGGGIVLQTENN